MKPYLQLALGDNDNPRGRALIAIHKHGNPSESLQKLVDIDGTSLKEAIWDEVLSARLMNLDIFDAEYVRVRPRVTPIAEENLEEVADLESRDLIRIWIDEESVLPEVVAEQTVVRYTIAYRDNVYRRTLNALADEIFRKKKSYQGNSCYVDLFRVAELITLVLKAYRDQDPSGIEFNMDKLKSYQSKLPYLNFSYIERALRSQDGRTFQEMTNYIDIFYLALKKDFPLTLKDGMDFSLDAASQNKIQEDESQLYYEFFHALFVEEYEKASKLREMITCHNNGCSLTEGSERL